MNIRAFEIQKNMPLGTDVSELIARVFGREQLELDRYVMEGAEVDYNREILFFGEKDNMLVAFCRVTISRSMPWAAMLGDVCTIPEARGQGLGRKILHHALQTVEQMGIRAIWLGTCNPVAARLYSEVGFHFVAGSNVMLRMADGTLFDYLKNYSLQEGRIQHGCGSFRIPMVPLFLSRGAYTLLDVNTGLFSTTTMTQCSCAGLYSHYEALQARGGEFAGYTDESGALYALASIEPFENGLRVDGFSLPGYEACIAPTMEFLCVDRETDVYATALECDKGKQELFDALGFVRMKNITYDIRQFQTQAILYGLSSRTNFRTHSSKTSILSFQGSDDK